MVVYGGNLRFFRHKGSKRCYWEVIADKRPTEKKCSRCGEIKSANEFYDKKRAKARKDGTVHSWVSLYASCKRCVDTVNNEVRPKYSDWYQQYRIENKEQISVKSKRHYVATKQSWWELVATKMKLECVDCGFNSHTSAFDFHHIDPEKKDFTVHTKFKGVPTVERWGEVSKEIEGCVLLCSNCHRIRHSKYNFVGINQ